MILGTFVAGPAIADQRDARLDPLFSALTEADNRQTASLLEDQIWRIWLEGPGDQIIDFLIRDGMEAMADGRIADALEAFDTVTRKAPDFAEGWNKRATVFYMLGDLDRSVSDIQRTLELEPRHFGALSGLGLIGLARGDKAAALAAFDRALAIHPHLPSKERIEALRRELQGKRL